MCIRDSTGTVLEPATQLRQVDAPGHEQHRLTHSGHDEKIAIPTHRNMILTLDELINDESPVPNAIVGDGVLLRQSLLLIFGSPKAGKSFLAMNLAMATSAGTGFAGFTVNGAHKVLLMSAEGGYYPNRERLKTMSRRFGASNPVRQNLAGSFDNRWKLDNDKDFLELSEVIRFHRPRVLVLDPFVRFHGLDENSASDMAHVVGRIRSLIEDFNLSVILVHHQGKAQANGARGSSVITGEYDSSIVLKKQVGAHELVFDMRHVESPPDRKVSFNPETLWFDSVGQGPIEAMLFKSATPLSKKELASKCVEEGLYSRPSNAYAGIDKAVKKGLIVQNADGTFSYREGNSAFCDSAEEPEVQENA
jgi:hypothetical protein